MRVIDRLYQYLRHRGLTAHAFERECNLANGYLKKQSNGKGTIGSETLEKITGRYIDLSLTWLITGKGSMLHEGEYKKTIDPGHVSEDLMEYPPPERLVTLLREKVALLESALSDKEKIIRLLEQRLETGHVSAAGVGVPGESRE